MLPTTKITKADGNTGVVRPGSEGILAIVAVAEKGTKNQAQAHTRTQSLSDTFGNGPLLEDAAYVMPVAGNPVVVVRADPATAASYGTVTVTGAGTSAITAAGAAPLDDFDAFVVFDVGGTIGVAGILYRDSLDAGVTFSAQKALGTATTLTIPNSGVAFALGAGTILAAQTVECPVVGPQITNSDLTASLEALRVSAAPFDAVYIDMDATAAVVSTVDTWLKALNARGLYKTAVLTCRTRSSGESEATYLGAIATIFDAAAGTDVVVFADKGDVTGTHGIVQGRRFGLFVAARGMAIDIAEDAAYVARGPLAGVSITDVRGNPKYHNEALFPGLDDHRIGTARTIDGFTGVFATNAPLLSPVGSDYVYWQHARCMNKACEITYQILTKQLSRGVDKNPKPGPNKARYIAEHAAQLLEGLVNVELTKQLIRPTRRLDDVRLSIARDDDISSNGPTSLTCTLESVSLAYTKKFNVTASYVKAISSTSAGQ